MCVNLCTSKHIYKLCIHNCMHAYIHIYAYVSIRMLTHMHRPTYYMHTDLNDKSLCKIIEQTCYTFYATNSVPFYIHDAVRTA